LNPDDFTTLITDYLDSLSYSKGTSSSIFKHQIRVEVLIERIVELNKNTNPLSTGQLKVEFSALIEKNTIEVKPKAIWSWKFPLEEWDGQYSTEDEKFTFKKIVDSNEINEILDIKSKRLKDQLTRRITNLTPKEFEHFVGALFGKQGWIENLKVTRYSQDGGIDFDGDYHPPGISVPYKFIGQAKHMKSKVGGPDMRNFLGALGQYPAGSIGYFVSTGGFNTEAIESSQSWPQGRVELYDLNRIIDMMVDDEIGLRPSTHSLMDPEFWSFTDD
jgi:restriction endonuclease Mrr